MYIAEFLDRTDDALDAGLVGESRQPSHRPSRRSGETDGSRSSCIDAGEQRHSQNADRPSASSLRGTFDGSLHHLAAARCVNGDPSSPDRGELGGGPADRVGDVVELGVGEHGLPG